MTAINSKPRISYVPYEDMAPRFQAADALAASKTSDDHGARRS